MSCSIHLHVELLVNGKWEHWARPTIRCGYWLFGKLAGVRSSEHRPIVAPRGFPDDASAATRMEYAYNHGDAHNASWLNTKEIMELEDWLETLPHKGSLGHGLDLEVDVLNWTHLFGSGITTKWRYADDDYDYAPGVDAVRFVFWFDN